jgi:hypothetical protein
MVGNPKTLHELRKVDADLQVTCRACARRVYVDREWLIAELMRRKRSTDWDAVRHQMRCSAEGCGSKDVQIKPVPFAGRDTPAPVQAVIDAMNAFIEAASARQGAELSELKAVGELRGDLHRATRRMIMWAKYGIEPSR